MLICGEVPSPKALIMPTYIVGQGSPFLEGYLKGQGRVKWLTWGHVALIPMVGPQRDEGKMSDQKKKWCKHQILELIPSFYRHLLGCRRPLPIGMSQGCGQHHKHLLWDRGRKGRAMSRLQINYHHFSPSSLFPSAFGVGDCGVLAVFPTCHFFTSRDYKDHLWFPCTWSVSLFWIWIVSLLCVWHTALYRKCWLIMSHPELGRWFSLEWGF